MTLFDFQRGDRLRLTKDGKSYTGIVRWSEPGRRFAIDLDGTPPGATYIATADWIASFDKLYGPNTSTFELVDNYEINQC